MRKRIGIARKRINKGDNLITYDFGTGDVKSDCIKFLPYGKKKTLSKIYDILNVRGFIPVEKDKTPPQTR